MVHLLKAEIVLMYKNLTVYCFLFFVTIDTISMSINSIAVSSFNWIVDFYLQKDGFDEFCMQAKCILHIRHNYPKNKYWVSENVLNAIT